jgi:hypothetical protein
MLQLDDDARKALEDNHEPSYVARAFYGEKLTETDVPLDTDGSLSYDGDAVKQATGSVHVRGGDRSLVPRKPTDSLAPYGQELDIYRVVAVGETSWEIPMGRFRIEDVPDMREYFRLWPHLKRVAGWDVQLQLVDRFDIIEADDFLVPDSPKAGNSTWDEIRRLSSLPIVVSLPDKPVPPALTYTSRMDAITALMSNIGGVPHLTRQGALTARVKDAWLTATTPVFTVDGVVEVSDSMSIKLYNSVASRSSLGDNNIVAVREIRTDGDPLSVTGPLRRRVYTHTSPLIETQAQADADAETVLRRVSQRQARTVKVTCLPRPDIEVGDFGLVKDRTTRRTFLGEVTSMRFSLNPFDDMTLEMIVAEEVDAQTDSGVDA